jgi:hypothetical protein
MAMAFASVAACGSLKSNVAAPCAAPTARAGHEPSAATADHNVPASPNSTSQPNAPPQPDVAAQTAQSPDLSLPGPGLARLMGVNEKEVWIAFEAPVDTPPPADGSPSGRRFTQYDAVLKLDDGCVSETYEWSAPYSSEGIRRYVAFLDRFPVHHTLGVATRERRFMHIAYSANKLFIAIETVGLNVSIDGGRTFTPLREPYAHSATFVDNRFLVAWVNRDNDENGLLTLLIYALPDLEHPRRVSVPDGYWLEGTEDSKLFFSHFGTRKSERCVSMLEVGTGLLESRYCMTGPPRVPNSSFAMTRSPNGLFGVYGTGDFDQMRIHIFDAHTGARLRTLSNHVFGMVNSELADDGSYVWQSSIDGLIYAAGERGTRVLSAEGDFLGLDLAGCALIFQRPPLARPHAVGALMPPVKGQLGDYRCRLIRRVDTASVR